MAYTVGMRRHFAADGRHNGMDDLAFSSVVQHLDPSCQLVGGGCGAQPALHRANQLYHCGDESHQISRSEAKREKLPFT